MRRLLGLLSRGKSRRTSALHRRRLKHGKHVWLDKPAGDDLEAFRAVLDLAREKGLLVQLGYMFRYNAGLSVHP